MCAHSPLVGAIGIACRRGSRILVRATQWSLDPKGGALSPQFAANMGFPLKLPQNCMILKTSWGQGGRAPGPPGSATGLLVKRQEPVNRCGCGTVIAISFHLQASNDETMMLFYTPGSPM